LIAELLKPQDLETLFDEDVMIDRKLKLPFYITD
jgi:hypothetical protein